MNKAILVGRLTKDPELRSTASGIPVCNFTVACDRRYQKQGEERQADFINCTAWQKSAESIAQYFKKGHRIALEGSIQTRSWTDNEGKTRYATEVVVEQWEFAHAAPSKSLISETAPMQGFPAKQAACGADERLEATVSKSEGGAVGQAVPGAAHFPNSKPTEPLDGDLDGFLPIEDDDLPF
ncbi:single-stranded DNA-binding protein [Ruminococcus sp.]|uniref:single-stranded DNA-binding protein n=1 Tax=Ruminococcus sp. TaxID=41978 RepID=UPI003AB324EE